MEILFTTLETKLADKSWTDTQDPEFINVLSGVKNIVQNMSTNIFIMLDYFQQYTEAIYTSPIFAGVEGAQSSDDGKVNPTQTSAAAPANRAEKRAAKKSGLILPEDKKLVTP